MTKFSNYLTSYMTSYLTRYLTSYVTSYLTSSLKSYLMSYVMSYLTSYVASDVKRQVTLRGTKIGLENAALGLRPRAAFSAPRSPFFTIRTDPKPANNLRIFFLTLSKQFFYTFTSCRAITPCFVNVVN